MPRPSRLPLLATVPTNRQEPLSGTLLAGWGSNTPFAVAHANWSMGFLADWVQYLDIKSPALSDEFQRVVGAVLVTGTGLTFTLGGPLQQRPVTGGVYVIQQARIDASALAADAPFYTFAGNSINYVFLGPPITRSAYPDVIINTTGVPPSPRHRVVRQVTTGAIMVTADTIPVSLLTGYYRVGKQFITGSLGSADTTLTVTCNASAAPGIWITSAAAATNTLMQFGPNVGQYSISTEPNGAGTPGFHVDLTNNSVMGYQAYSLAPSTDTAAFVQTVPFTSNSFGVALTSLAAIPANGTQWDTYCRLFATIQTPSGGFRWRDGTGAAASAWTPHAHRETTTIYTSQVSANVTLGGDVGPITLCARFVSLRQRHVYHMAIDCEALATVGASIAQTVTVLIDGVPHPDWNARLLMASPTGLPQKWYSTLLLYYHTLADDATTNVLLQITHTVGVGTVTYIRPRIYIFGPFSAP